jgi:hypothetical protein
MLESIATLFGWRPDAEQRTGKPLSSVELKRDATTVGMVQYGSVTFAIWRFSTCSYGVVRLIDDRYLGSFDCRRDIAVCPESDVDATLLRRIAQTAQRLGRTAWYPASA